MEINQATSKTDRIFGYLKLIARITLTISSTLLLISTVLLLVYKEQCFSLHSHTGDVIWPTILISVYSLLYSFVMILVFVIYKTYQGNLTTALFKKETLLFILTGLLLAIFYFLNNYTINTYY
jgi:hypothetical protein